MQINYPKGRIFVYGYFFKDNSSSQAIILERIIGSWASNTKAFKHPEGILLLWEDGISIAIDDCIAIPIMREKNLYANTLLSEKQQNEFWGRGEFLHLVLEGVLHLSLISKLEKFDPSIWIEAATYPLEPLNTLGFVPPAKNNSVGELKKIRDLLSTQDLRESDAQLKAVRLLSDPSALNGNNGKPKNIISIAIAALQDTFSKKAKSKSASAEVSSYDVSKPKTQSILAKLRDALQNHLMASKLGQLIGRRQAQYIQEMMEKFESDDLTDALRHAIPLSNIQDAMNSTRAAIGRPGMRNQLSISPSSARGATGSLNVGDQVMQHMRQVYHAAFSRLDKADRFEEAAFVLAELLRDIDRAVKYLEEHGQLVLAAQLAEGQRLPPARIVRQWLIAGDIQRAIQIATIASCYQEAITLLEANHKSVADHLRWHCAQLHFRAGDYATAIHIAWPLEKHRQEILSWLHLSINESSALSGVHWIKLILQDTNQWQQHFARFAELLKEDLPQLQSAHFLMIDEILKADNSAVNKLLADLIIRSYLRLVALRKLSFHSKRWQKLIERAGDRALRADCRNLDFKSVAENPIDDTEHYFQFDVAQGRKLCDMARLTNGNFVFAFGEPGVEIYNQHGKLISRFSEPCHSIILSDFGNQALFVAQRSGYQIISRYMLATNSVVTCFDTTLSCWSSSFDGINWLVAKGNSVWLLDMQATSPTVIWSVDEPDRSVIAFERTTSSVSIILKDDAGFELWMYALPNLFLRERNPIQKKTLSTFHPVTFNSKGVVAGINSTDTSQFAIFPRTPPITWSQVKQPEGIIGMKLSDTNLFVFSKGGDEIHCCRYFLENEKIGKQLGTFSFLKSDSIITRVVENNVLFATSEGRIIVFNLSACLVESDFVI